jgi:hypothetical protein
MFYASPGLLPAPEGSVENALISLAKALIGALALVMLFEIHMLL